MRRWGVLAILALVVVAGCTRPAAELKPTPTPAPDPGVVVVARDGGTAAPAPSTPSSSSSSSSSSPSMTAQPPLRIPFAAPVELPLVGGIGGGEPNLAALSDGTLFVSAPSGLQMGPNAMQGAAYLWRSTDGGATWEAIRAPTAGPGGLGAFCSCDADVETSADGYVYYADWWASLTGAPGNYVVEASKDGGKTWTSSPVTTREALSGNVDREWIVPGPDGFVGLFYTYNFPIAAPAALAPDIITGIHAVYSTDHGATWSDPVVVVAPAAQHALQIGHPRAFPDGTLALPYGDVDGSSSFFLGPSQAMIAISKDHGSTWSSYPVGQAPKGFDSLWAVQAEIDSTGAMHEVWSARVTNDTMGTFVATSLDQGRTWSPALALRTDGNNVLPWIATAPNGTIAAAWYGSNVTGDPAKASADWFAYVAQSHDGGRTFAVQRVSDTPIKHGAICPRGSACSSDRELLDYLSLAYSSDGALHIAYARSDGGVAQTLVSTALKQV